MEHICPILDRVTAVEATKFSRDPWSVVRCQETGFVFLVNPPEYAQLETEYAWEKTAEIERQRRNAEEPVVARVSAFAKTMKKAIFPKRSKIASLALAELMAKDQSAAFRVLDIGCGWGDLLMEISDRCAAFSQKVVPIGIEVSRQMAADAHEKVASLGGRVICKNALDACGELDDETIHLVVMNSFLEHECQPHRLLTRLHSVLASNGTILLKVPNYACWNRTLRGDKWCGFRFPDHVNYFAPKTLKRLAKETGFTVTRQRFSDKLPLSDNMYAVLAKTA